MRPRVTVVLPTPLWVPAMSTAGIMDNVSDGLIKCPSSGKDINTLEDVFGMLVGVVKRGKYGERLLETIKTRTDFQVVSVEVPQVLPGFIEDPEEFVRELNLDPRIFQADLLILYTFHPDLTPEIVRLAGQGGVKAVIIPGGIGRAGSIGELEKIAEKYNIHIEVDEICCTLEECGIPTVDEFAKHLGKPELEVETKDGRISNVKVLRGSPCGATWHAAAGIVGKNRGRGTFHDRPILPAVSLSRRAGRPWRHPHLRRPAQRCHGEGSGQSHQLRLPEQSKPIKIEPGKKGEKA